MKTAKHAQSGLGFFLLFFFSLTQLAVTGEHWENRATGIPRRTGNSAIWTGTEMIVWGGGSQSVWLGDGGRYDLQTDSWRPTANSGAPSPRWFHGAVWSGTQMLVWGGRASFYTTAMFNDGARYNPGSNYWEQMSSVNAPSARSQFPSIWTGTEMLVWGGWGPNDATLGDGGRYNPATDSWSPISSLNAPIARTEPTAVWTGHEMIIFGGIVHSAAGELVTCNSGGRYDPQTDTWTPLPTNGAPAVTAHTAVWTGTDMIVWGGRHLPGNDQVNTGARYNLAEDKWYPIAAVTSLSPRMYQAAVWSGSEMLVWGGISGSPTTMYNDGGRYNPANDAWTAITQINAAYRRQFWRPDLGIWTGQGLLFYGGSDYPNELDSTALYVPDHFDASPSIVSQPADLVVVEGHSADFAVTAEGSEPISYQWSFNANAILDATNASLHLNSAQLSDAGLYTVTITNNFGLITSAVARLTLVQPSTAFDLVADYSTNNNPAGVWSYGWKSSVGSAFNLFTRHGYDIYGDGTEDDYWLKPAGGPSAVYHNPGTITITNNDGQGVYPPGTVWFGPGYNGAEDNFGVIRFSVPSGADGVYRIAASVHTSLDGAIAGDSDFRVARNGVEIFVQQVAPNSGTSFVGSLSLNGGDTIDFLSGRGADGQEYGSGFKIQALITLHGSNLVSTAPFISSFSPGSGPTGTVVTISGHNFGASADHNVVYFGDFPGIITAASADSITAIVPAGANFGPIQVIADGLSAQSAAPFHVIFPARPLDISAFSGPQSFSPGDGPIATGVADLDGDGLPDFAVANFYSGTVSVYGHIGALNSSDPSAQSHKDDFPAGTGPWDLFLADIDGDGKLDLVVANIDANTVSVLRNLSTPGHMSFADRVVFPVGASPHQIVAGDLDGDGRADVITANYQDGTISVLHNSGQAPGEVSFESRVDFVSGFGAHGVGLADLDGDGKLDVVVARHVTDSPTSVVFRNTSSPGWIDASSLIVVAHLPGNGNWVTFGDLDGDGKPDLVIPSWYSANVSVFRNNATPGNLSDASFGPPIILSSPGRVKRAMITDLDGDGRLDIAFPTELNSALSFYQNVGGSNALDASWFGPRNDLGAGWNGDGISIADIDLDGLPDLLFCNFYDDTVYIYHGQRLTPAAITAEPISQTVPLGSNVVIRVVATGGQLDYHWYRDGLILPNSTGPAIFFQSVHAADAGDYFVVVQNSTGSATSQVATLTVLVDRLLLLGAIPDVNEGDLVSVPLQLRSQGDVGGLDFTIEYNAGLLAAPEILWDSSLDGALQEFNVPRLGQLRGVLALPATTIPGGTQTLALIQFRARTVAQNTTAHLGPRIVDISNDAGDPIYFGSDAIGTTFGILDTGSLAGDNNGNHRLDIGDASLVMRLIAQLDSIRAWDLAGNDLNYNKRLDSGDVIKILRIIAGIDAPPQQAFALSTLKTSASALISPASTEVAVLSPVRLQGVAGQLVTVQLRLDGLITPISGASLTLNYPVDAVRFQSAQSHRVGSTVPGNAVAIWNVAPAQNNYAIQNGHITLALSGSTAWAASDAVLAEFTFEIQPGASAQYQWPISLSAVEVTGNGYNNRALSVQNSVFIGRNAFPGAIANLRRGASGDVSFDVSGDMGATYLIDASEDLVHWSPLRSISNASGSFSIIDSDAHGLSHRFYRAIPAPAP